MKRRVQRIASFQCGKISIYGIIAIAIITCFMNLRAQFVDPNPGSLNVSSPGNVPSIITHDPNSTQLRDMMTSSSVKRATNKFYAAGAPSITRFAHETVQIDGYAGATIKKNKNGTANYKIVKTSSFLTLAEDSTPQLASEKELIGTYQSVLQDGTPRLPDGGTEILELKPNGVCEQNITLMDGSKLSTTATWHYDKSEKEVELRGTYIAVVELKKMNPNISETKDTLDLLPVKRNLAGRIILGSRVGTHYEMK